MNDLWFFQVVFLKWNPHIILVICLVIVQYFNFIFFFPNHSAYTNLIQSWKDVRCIHLKFKPVVQVKCTSKFNSKENQR